MNLAYIVDRILHWLSVVLILYMLLNMGSQIHLLDYRVKGQLQHRQDSIELHALVGMVLLLILVGRMIWSATFRAQIPRNQVANKLHQGMINTVHLLLYLVVAALAISGVLMAGNSELTLQLPGFELSTPENQNISEYSRFQQWHWWLINAFWWLIGLHFVGAMYARR